MSCDAIVYPPELPFRVAKLEELDDIAVAKFSAFEELDGCTVAKLSTFEELDVCTVEELPFREAELGTKELEGVTVAKLSASFLFASASSSFPRHIFVFTTILRASLASDPKAT